MSPRPSRLLVLAAVVVALLLLAPAAFATPLDTGPGTLVQIAIQQAELTDGGGAAGDSFGYSVAIDGDTALVGSPYRDIGTSPDQGAACVFTRSAGVWTLQQELTEGGSYGSFGWSVALSGDTALVGVRQNNCAYVFTRSGTTWTQQQRLRASDDAFSGGFGHSVALSGDSALVGACDKTVGVNADQGAAYVFTRVAGIWAQQQKLTDAAGAAGDRFGQSVALEGDTAVVGAAYKTVGANADQGAALVFARSAGNWALQQELTAADGTAYDFFGYSVALDGESVLVGACNKTVGTRTIQGAAYVFTRDGTTWTQQQKLTAADGARNDNFGCSVALDGESALVGAWYKTVGTNAGEGAAYRFTRSGTTWTQQQRLSAGDGAGGDYFGSAVGLSGDTVLIGAYHKTVGTSAGQGAAFAFALGAPPTVTIGAPTAAGIWPPGSVQSVSWELGFAPRSGESRVALVNQTSGTWYVNKTLPSVTGRTVYATKIIVAVPAGTYKAAVYWRPTGAAAWASTAKSAAFVVTPIDLTISAPAAGAVWQAQGLGNATWEVDPELTTGEFRLSLVNQTSGTWYVNRLVPAAAGKTSYAASLNAAVPPGSYKLAVYWRASSSSAWDATQKSAAFTVASLAISSPTALSSWPRLSSQSVEWSVTPGLAAGEFRVWLINQTSGAWSVGKSVAVVKDQTAYETNVWVSVAAGSYKAAVYWRPDAASPWTLAQKSAAFTVTP
jgi:hypothetical protein